MRSRPPCSGVPCAALPPPPAVKLGIQRPPTPVSPSARINKGGRPYHCGRAPESCNPVPFSLLPSAFSPFPPCLFPSPPCPVPPPPPLRLRARPLASLPPPLASVPPLPPCRPSLPPCPALLRRALPLPLMRARAYIIKGAVPLSLDGSHPLCFFCVFMQKSRGKVWPVREFVVPLHPLNREAPCEADEEAIFESIT